jgi:hypothetical protein
MSIDLLALNFLLIYISLLLTILPSHSLTIQIDFDEILLNGKVEAPKYVLNEQFKKLGCEKGQNLCHSCAETDKCWHNKICQRYEHSYYTNDNGKKAPCHELCLGACVDTTSKGCYVCEDISEDDECVESCSAERLLNTDSRRCITREECTRLGRKIYNKECLAHCPINYSEELNESSNEISCMPCIGKCHKICNFRIISKPNCIHEFFHVTTVFTCVSLDSVAAMEQVGTGCTIINGSLEIEINEDVRNLNEELNKYLGDVEVIMGTVKIHRYDTSTTHSHTTTCLMNE